MKAEVTTSQLYWNDSLLDFFFRKQSRATFEALIERAEHPTTAINQIEGYAEETDTDLETLEEMFYNDSLEEIAKEIGIDLEEEEEEEEEENTELEQMYQYEENEFNGMLQEEEARKAHEEETITD